ncbi:VOC family protein, partial [Intrasporangium sp.]|uniref:VOC family protein n=1 Tax=Intrasporangium sp. TaxID=1925024 RepID=UPI003221B70B
MPTFEAFSHVTLTVTDLEASVAWYARSLGMRRGPDMSGPGWRRTIMLGGPGIVLGLQAHDRTPEGDRFDETRVGLDHVSIACPDRAGVQAWLTRLDDAGVAHS